MLSPVLDLINEALGSDAARVIVPALVGVAGIVIGILATRRKNTREDRATFIGALHKARRFQAPRGYYDLDDDLAALREAAVPFPALTGHVDLLERVTRALWRDSRDNWAESGGLDPFAGACDAELSKVRDDISMAVSRRVRLGPWRRRLGVRSEHERLVDTADLPRWAHVRSRPRPHALLTDPTGAIDFSAQLRRATERSDDEPSRW